MSQVTMTCEQASQRALAALNSIEAARQQIRDEAVEKRQKRGWICFGWPKMSIEAAQFAAAEKLFGDYSLAKHVHWEAEEACNDVLKLCRLSSDGFIIINHKHARALNFAL